MEDQGIHESFEISKILSKHIQQQSLTEHEQNRLDGWLAANERNKELLASLTDEDSLIDAMMEMYDAENDLPWENVRQRLCRVRTRECLKYWIPIAAILAVVISIGQDLCTQDRKCNRTDF